MGLTVAKNNNDLQCCKEIRALTLCGVILFTLNALVPCILVQIVNMDVTYAIIVFKEFG